jgi:hypothetical protein
MEKVQAWSWTPQPSRATGNVGTVRWAGEGGNLDSFSQGTPLTFWSYPTISYPPHHHQHHHHHRTHTHTHSRSLRWPNGSWDDLTRTAALTPPPLTPTSTALNCYRDYNLTLHKLSDECLEVCLDSRARRVGTGRPCWTWKQQKSKQCSSRPKPPQRGPPHPIENATPCGQSICTISNVNAPTQCST